MVASEAPDPLIAIVRDTLHDLGRRDLDRCRVTLDSTLVHDLGLDSLARVELFTRIERELGVRLPEDLFAAADALREIRRAIDASGSRASERRPRVQLSSETSSRTTSPPADVATLTGVLAWHAEHHPGFVQITLCEDEKDTCLTYEALYARASTVAAGLQQQGLRSGDTVALMLPTSAEYFMAFFGVLLAGGVPVPLYPPTRLSQIEEHVRRHARILENAQAATLITTPEMRRLASMLRVHSPALRRIFAAQELVESGGSRVPVAISPDSIAFLQYTSGSTGQPKGVVLTHGNLLANIAGSGAAIGAGYGDRFVSWLPLYHDMGLIGAWLAPLYFGLASIFMSPLAFLARPVRWLDVISHRRGTLSAAPNFAYELCLKRVTDEELANLDLSCWRIAMNGAEAVMPDTLRRFQTRFGPCGFAPTAMTPVYGLAECSVGLTFPPLERGPLIDVIDRDTFVGSGAARPASADAAHPLQFVSCGLPLRGHAVRIVDEAGREVAERVEGRLEFMGPSATSGYFRNPTATEQLLRPGGWRDSGDRAYIAGGEVFLTGRIKDIIIRAGRHIYPDEVEAAVGQVRGVRKGCVAVFGGRDRASGTERVIVMAETYARTAEERRQLRDHIVETVVGVIGEPPDDVALAPPHTVLKTSSGKLRRAASREVYERGGYQKLHSRSGLLAPLRVWMNALGPMSRRTGRRMVELGYAAYFWTVLTLLAAPTYLLLQLPFAHAARWRIAHVAARAFVALVGVRFSVEGEHNLSREDVRIIAANHSSYLDGIFLTAAVGRPCRFIVKRELARTPVIGRALRRLGSEFVERLDVRESADAARRLAAIAADGPPCIFFPEGTFRRAPGLLPFHLGAFAAAVASRSLVAPVALRGTRLLLRDEQWLPRRTEVALMVGAPIGASNAPSDFAAAVRLRDAVRGFIRQHCGEPDLLG